MAFRQGSWVVDRVFSVYVRFLFHLFIFPACLCQPPVHMHYVLVLFLCVISSITFSCVFPCCVIVDVAVTVRVFSLAQPVSVRSCSVHPFSIINSLQFITHPWVLHLGPLFLPSTPRSLTPSALNPDLTLMTSPGIFIHLLELFCYFLVCVIACWIDFSRKSTFKSNFWNVVLFTLTCHPYSWCILHAFDSLS